MQDGADMRHADHESAQMGVRLARNPGGFAPARQHIMGLYTLHSAGKLNEKITV